MTSEYQAQRALGGAAVRISKSNKTLPSPPDRGNGMNNRINRVARNLHVIRSLSVILQ